MEANESNQLSQAVLCDGRTTRKVCYFYDEDGNLVKEYSPTDNSLTSYQYTVTEELTHGAATYENEYTYNGESYNPNIHSQYLRARYYSVVTASFLTEDSYLGNIREPLTLNRYNYCISSYLNYVDPSGNTALWELLGREIAELELRLVAPVIRSKIDEARDAIREAGDAVKGAVDSAEEWVVNRVAEMMLDFASQGETQANLVLTYIIVGENVYVCTESMKDAFLDRPSRLKIQAERMDLVQSYHIGRYGARVCQVAVGIGETALGIWAMLSGMPTGSVSRYDPWNIPKGGWGSLAVPIANIFSARLAGAVGACYGAVSTGIALGRALEEIAAMADIALGTVAITGTENRNNFSYEKKVTNSAGQEVTRNYVKNQDELLKKAEEAAGGDLDDFIEIKPGWYQNKEGTIKIKWNPEGHVSTNEGPHVTIRHLNENGRWEVIEKYFIEGWDTYKR